MRPSSLCLQPIGAMHEYKVCVCVCVFVYISVNISQHPSTPASYASRLQQQPVGVIYVQQCNATSSSLTLGQSDMDKEVSHIPDRIFWNSLPLTVRDPSLSLTQFCAQLEAAMFSRAQ